MRSRRTLKLSLSLQQRDPPENEETPATQNKRQVQQSLQNKQKKSSLPAQSLMKATGSVKITRRLNLQAMEGMVFRN